MAKLVCLLSGGLDSSTLLYDLRGGGYKVHTLSFNYGQRHSKELTAAMAVATEAGVPWDVIDLSKGLGSCMRGSALTSKKIQVPEGHYEDATMKATVVPNRNMVFIALATAFAISHGCEGVAIAAHAGDHAVYPDCRGVFLDAMDKALGLCDYESLRLYRPFWQITKAQIVEKGAALKVPFELTWSCYKGGDLHCGKCGTCVERIEAFQLAGVPDPTEYEEVLHKSPS